LVTNSREIGHWRIKGRKEKIGSPFTPKSLGEEIGKVVFSNEKKIILKTEHLIHNGDGLCYTDKNGQLKGFLVNAVENNTLVPHNAAQPPKGTIVYRNQDIQFIKKLENSKTSRKINIQFSLQDTENGLLLLVKDEDFIYSEHLIETEKNIAKNIEKNRHSITQNLNKLGDTPYRTESVDFYWSEEYFIPMSVLSHARRTLLEKHNQKRISKHPQNRKAITPNSVNYYKPKADYRFNIANRLAEQFYQRHGVEIKEKAFELLQEDKEYHLMTTKYCIRYENNWCPKHHKDANKIPSPLFIRDQQNYVYQLDFDCKKCVMNVIKIKES